VELSPFCVGCNCSRQVVSLGLCNAIKLLGILGISLQSHLHQRWQRISTR
jgi:hypothetical protein